MGGADDIALNGAGVYSGSLAPAFRVCGLRSRLIGGSGDPVHPTHAVNTATNAAAKTDVLGLSVFVAAVAVALMGLLILPWPAGCVAILAFVVLNFAGHAAIHLDLVGGNTLARRMANEIILLISYALHFSAFQFIVAAHLQHHAEGRTQQYGAPDVTEAEPQFLDRVRYYAFLLFVPYNYWIARSIGALIFSPTSRSLPSEPRPIKFILPIAASGACVLLLLIGAALNDLRTLVAYWLVTSLIWNVLQNVAHYGLGGADAYLDRVAARTYIVGPVFRVLTYGSLAHLPHHVDMRISGRSLHLPETMRQAESIIGGQIPVIRGMRNYLRDVRAQFRGPMSKSRLSMDWIVK